MQAIVRTPTRVSHSVAHRAATTAPSNARRQKRACAARSRSSAPTVRSAAILPSSASVPPAQQSLAESAAQARRRLRAMARAVVRARPALEQRVVITCARHFPAPCVAQAARFAGQARAVVPRVSATLLILRAALSVVRQSRRATPEYALRDASAIIGSSHRREPIRQLQQRGLSQIVSTQ
jgi:hypothetical protein